MNIRREKAGTPELSPPPSADGGALAVIRDAISEIRHGTIQIHIQDGHIVQIDKVNKIRVR